MTKDQIRAIFMAHGFTIKDGQTDLKSYVYEAAEALIAALATPAPLSDEPVAIYQMQLRGSDWADVEKRTFDDLPRIRRRIVYAAPPATPSDKQEAVGAVPGGNGYPEAMVIKNDPCAHCGGRGCFACLRNAPPAQSAEQDRIDAEQLSKLLPGNYYMDPPDGGSVTLLEQLQRMAHDARRYRCLRNCYSERERMDVADQWDGAMDESLDAAIAKDAKGARK